MKFKMASKMAAGTRKRANFNLLLILDGKQHGKNNLTVIVYAICLGSNNSCRKEVENSFSW